MKRLLAIAAVMVALLSMMVAVDAAPLVSIKPQLASLPATSFNTNNFPPDTTGAIRGSVVFGQNQLMPYNASRIPGNVQPHLTANRTALVLFKATAGVDVRYAVQLQVTNDLNPSLVSPVITMKHPNDLPKQPKFSPSAPPASSFWKALSPTKKIAGNANLALLNNASGAGLQQALLADKNVTILLADGAWTSDIYFPNGNFTANAVVITSTAGYSTAVHYTDVNGQPSVLTVVTGVTVAFRNVLGKWVSSEDIVHSTYVYGAGYWSAIVPFAFVQIGMRITFIQGNLTGVLSAIAVGPPTELWINCIDIGMLVPPRGQFSFADDKTLQREYFQTIPVSKLTVNNYEPVYLKEVMMPSGTLLKTIDPSVGDWHGGNMRNFIGNILITIGINNANYGITSSTGTSLGGHPYRCAQLTAHNSKGNYSNGVVVHGGTGGAGTVTVESSIGNEWSHEVGHNFGLGHYNGGPKGSIHRPANDVDSTWGWDSDLNQLSPNFNSVAAAPGTNASTCCCPDSGATDNTAGGTTNGPYPRECVAPFLGKFSFGTDSMAGGFPLWNNRYTMYTPYVMQYSQSTYFEQKLVFSQTSPSGFRQYNATSKRMDPAWFQANQFSTASVDPKQAAKQLPNGTWVANATYIQTLLVDPKVDLVLLNFADGWWSAIAAIPAASNAFKNMLLTIQHDASYSSTYTFLGTQPRQQLVYKRGMTSTWKCTGTAWVNVTSKFVGVKRNQAPILFGVPVATIVGFYDPTGKLTSYVYDALYGGYGLVYPDDAAATNPSKGCFVNVTAASRSMIFKVSQQLFQSDGMNKFHVNVPRSANPTVASVVCGGKILAQRKLSPPKLPPRFNVISR